MSSSQKEHNETNCSLPRSGLALRALLLLAMVVLFPACVLNIGDPPDEPDGGGDADVVQPEPGDYGTPFVHDIDPAVAPIRTTAPRPDGEEAAVEGVRGPNGETSSFVVGELLLSGEEGALEELVDSFGGRVISTTDPAVFGFEDMEPFHLVEVDVSTADLELFEDDMRNAGPEGLTMGELAFTSEAGARTFALAARALAEGAGSGIIWVGRSETIEELTSPEAPVSNSSWPLDAFDWSHFSSTSSMAIGVDMAWALLEHHGRLTNDVGLAILDGGFCPDGNDDFPPTLTEIDVSPSEILMGDETDLCRSLAFNDTWHGTHVFVAAMGTHDNGYGSAGPASPVAAPQIAINVLYDPYTTSRGLLVAANQGADIASMSYRWTLPYGTGWTMRNAYENTADAVTDAGMILFGSAGNEDTDVDNEGCVGVRAPNGTCIGDQDELMLHLPCELDVVTCVGGVGRNSTTMHGNSNFGTDDVDIVGPYVVPQGPDPDDMTNDTDTLTGTSFATPFVAGVAALVWAADPSLTNEEVRQWLYDTTQPVTAAGNPTRRGLVCASCVVQALLPEATPEVEIVSPPDGATYMESDTIRFAVEASDVEDAVLGTALDIEWTETSGPTAVSSTDAEFEAVLCPGAYTVEVSVTDADGNTTTEQVSFAVAPEGFELSIVGQHPRQARVTVDVAGNHVIDPLDLSAIARRPTCDDPDGDDVPQEPIEWLNVTSGDDLGVARSITITEADLADPTGATTDLVPIEFEASLEIAETGEVDFDTVRVEPCSSSVGLAPGEEMARGYPQCSLSAVYGDIHDRLERTFGTSDPDRIDLIVSGRLDELVDLEFADDLVENEFCDPRVCDPPIPMSSEEIRGELLSRFGEFSAFPFEDLYAAFDTLTLGGLLDQVDVVRSEAAFVGSDIDPEALRLFEGAVASIQAAVAFFASPELGGRDGFALLAHGASGESLHENVDMLATVRASLDGYLTGYLASGETADPFAATAAAFSTSREAVRQFRMATDDSLDAGRR